MSEFVNENGESCDIMHLFVFVSFWAYLPHQLPYMKMTTADSANFEFLIQHTASENSQIYEVKQPFTSAPTSSLQRPNG